MSLNVMAITHLRLFARPGDWQDTARFYEEALALTLTFTDAATGVAMFSIGELKLLVERVDDEEEAAALSGRFSGISFRVRDVTRAAELLQSRGTAITGGPEKQPWGDTLLHVRDPAGNVITLIEFGQQAGG